jgi:hypothetical protein
MEPSYCPERFTKQDWSEFYPRATEASMPITPEERGLSVTTTCFVDADQSVCRVTWCYRSQSWEVRETVSLGYPKLMVN